MISINPDKHITVTLGPQEQSLLLEQSVAIDEWILTRVRKSKHRSKRDKLTFSLDEYESLLNAIANEAGHVSNQKHSAAFQNLHARLANRFAPSTTETDPQLPHKLMTGPMEDLSAFLQRKSFGSIEELNLELGKLTDVHNRRSDPEMGGLSPNQVAQLIHFDWDNPNNPIKLNDRLLFSDLQNAEFLLNTRIFLQALQGSKGPTATAKGNLNRKFVSQMLEKMHWPDGYLEQLRKYNKVVNEHDVFPLHIIRTVCECAGLMQKRKTSFVITTKAKRLLTDEQIGSLYALLFHMFFRKFNLAYLDRLPDYPGIQSTIAYSLYRLGKVAKTWQPIESLLTDILLPNVLRAIEDGVPVYREVSWPIEKRLILPLEEFGLVECRYESKADRLYPALAAVKLTELFSKFIHFEFNKQDY